MKAAHQLQMPLNELVQIANSEPSSAIFELAMRKQSAALPPSQICSLGKRNVRENASQSFDSILPENRAPNLVWLRHLFYKGLARYFVGRLIRACHFSRCEDYCIITIWPGQLFNLSLQLYILMPSVETWDCHREILEKGFQKDIKIEIRTQAVICHHQRPKKW